MQQSNEEFAKYGTSLSTVNFRLPEFQFLIEGKSQMKRLLA